MQTLRRSCGEDEESLDGILLLRYFIKFNVDELEPQKLTFCRILTQFVGENCTIFVLRIGCNVLGDQVIYFQFGRSYNCLPTTFGQET